MILPRNIPEDQYNKVEEKAKRFLAGFLTLRNLKLWLRIDVGWSKEQIDEFVEANEYHE